MLVMSGNVATPNTPVLADLHVLPHDAGGGRLWKAVCSKEANLSARIALYYLVVVLARFSLQCSLSAEAWYCLPEVRVRVG